MRKNAVVRIIAGGLIGAGVGWLVYRFIGCSTGTCPITSNPYSSVLLFALLGLLVSMPKKNPPADDLARKPEPSDSSDHP